MYKYLHILTIQRMSPYFLDEPFMFWFIFKLKHRCCVSHRSHSFIRVYFKLDIVVITSMSCQWLYFSRFLFSFLFHDSHLFFCYSKTFIYVKKAVVIYRGEKLSFPFVSRCSHTWLHRKKNGKLSFINLYLTNNLVEYQQTESPGRAW